MLHELLSVTLHEGLPAATRHFYRYDTLFLHTAINAVSGVNAGP